MKAEDEASSFVEYNSKKYTEGKIVKLPKPRRFEIKEPRSKTYTLRYEEENKND